MKSLSFLFAVATCSTLQLSAGTASHTFTGVTTQNAFVGGEFEAEFPVGTRWTAVVEWDTSASASFLSETQGGYPASKMTVSLQGVSGNWTTSSLPNEATYSLGYVLGGTQDEIQFNSGWGPTKHTNQNIESLQVFSINVVLNDPTATAIPALSPAPTGIDLSAWNLGSGDSYFKMYLSNDGSKYIQGSIDAPVASGKPEIEVQQPASSKLTDGKSKKSFGTAIVDGKGVAKKFTIKNKGKGDLTGISVSVAGKHKDDFNVRDLEETSLGKGKSTTFKVIFKPSKKGTRKAEVLISSNDSDENPFNIDVTGKGAEK